MEYGCYGTSVESAAGLFVRFTASWLKISADEIAVPENRKKLALVSRRLLNEAEKFYRSGDDGLWHLSFRSACAVGAARHVYAEIGSLLLRKGHRAWDQRTYVTGWRKISVIMQAVTRVVASIPRRVMEPWTPASIKIVWKYSEVR